MRCDGQQRRTLERLFAALDGADLAYVVPRGHQDLPASFPGSDLDLFVAPDDFEGAMAACERVGLDPAGSAVSNVTSLLGRALRRPRAAIAFVLDTPRAVPGYLRRQLDPREPTRRGRRDHHYGTGELDVHLFNHLAYTSPMNGARIRVDPDVERWMLERREAGSLGAVPAPPDELLHLVCRGVFDYEGTFPPYYRDRCDGLVERVTSEPRTDGAFRRGLERVFFAAGGVVYDHTVAGEYDAIRPALYRFADY